MAISTGAAILGSAAIGALGGSKKSGGGTTTTTSTPWAPQQPYLESGFGYAQDAYNNALNMGAYTDPRVAGLNPYMTGGADQLANFSNQYSFPLANLSGNTAAGMIAPGGMAGYNAANLFGQYGGDPTQQILNNAGQYANNPFVDGLIDASGRDVTRQLFERDLPGINRAASGSGNLNSTRAGVESAIATRGAGDRLADISSQIRSQFFGKGLDMSQNQYNQNLQNLLNTNSQLLNSYNLGTVGADRSQNLAAGGFDALNTAGGMYRGYDQAMIDAAMAQFAEQRNLPQQFASTYMNTVDGNFGGTGTSTAPSTGGGFMGALQGGLGGAFGGIGTLGSLKQSSPGLFSSLFT